MLTNYIEKFILRLHSVDDKNFGQMLVYLPYTETNGLSSQDHPLKFMYKKTNEGEPGRWWRDRWERSPLPLGTSEMPS